VSAPAQGGSTASPAGPRGLGIFWASLLGFVLHALAAGAGPSVAPDLAARGAPVLSYVLLGAFALALGYVSGVVLGAVRSRIVPARGDLVRALLLTALVAVHAAVLVSRWTA
jgi:hypothetical protein